MFTSRAEYRLRLRADNADQRLTPTGVDLGCVGAERRAAFAAKRQALEDGRRLLESLTLTPNEAARHGLELNRDGRRRSAFELLAFPDIDMVRLAAIWPAIGGIAPAIAGQLEVDARYASYVDRQAADIEALRKEEGVRIPPEFAYAGVSGLSAELRQKLEALRPSSLAQAARMEGMTPAALHAAAGPPAQGSGVVAQRRLTSLGRPHSSVVAAARLVADRTNCLAIVYLISTYD